MLIGLISGSGTDSWPGLQDARAETCQTSYGPVELMIGRIGGVDVVHLTRHGRRHQRLSNHVNHLANLSALIETVVDAV
ncbi:MAG: MTAP family purine nucleoside phosphorylase, partial [Acidimicrobiales bacterium]